MVDVFSKVTNLNGCRVVNLLNPISSPRYLELDGAVKRKLVCSTNALLIIECVLMCILSYLSCGPVSMYGKNNKSRQIEFLEHILLSYDISSIPSVQK